MNKKEKAQLRRAIHLLHHENDYDGGMEILVRLAGLKVNRMEVKPCTVSDLVKGHEDRKGGPDAL